VSEPRSDHKRRASLSPSLQRKAPRLAVGRARALGLPTRGTTNANRLRRVDRWLIATQLPRLRDSARPLVVDLGYGSSAVTTLELVDRLSAEVDRLEVVGLEIDPARVAAVAADRDPPRVDFRIGGFELAALQPVLVRAFNVLRQYDEASAAQAWDTMRASLGPGGVIVEGTCDEWGRRSAWVALDADGPLTLTFATRVSDIATPSDLAERLPKALIHHNVPGQPGGEGQGQGSVGVQGHPRRPPPPLVTGAFDDHAARFQDNRCTSSSVRSTRRGQRPPDCPPSDRDSGGAPRSRRWGIRAGRSSALPAAGATAK
jgi:hypothetical protein